MRDDDERSTAGRGGRANGGDGMPRDSGPSPGDPPFTGDPRSAAAADWERLRDAGAGGQGGASPPPGGPPSLASLVVLLETLRGVIPSDLERQLSALLREVLLTLRAFIDWYLERLDGSKAERRVEDIPID